MASRTILDKIVRHKRSEVARLKQARSIETVCTEAMQAPPPRDLAAALRVPGVSLIAEIKRASPSKGLLCADLDPVRLATTYAANGAAAISVLTDEHFFQGKLAYLTDIKSSTSNLQPPIPVLRKDFILDPYQVYEARAAGADAILLILAALSDDEANALYRLTRTLGMAALVEVHDEAELARALEIGSRIVGVNNRDLRTFEVSLETTARLRPHIPADVVLVSESGVHTSEDVARLAAIGVNAMLVGEALVRAADVGGKVRELSGGQSNVKRKGG